VLAGSGTLPEKLIFFILDFWGAKPKRRWEEAHGIMGLVQQNTFSSTSEFDAGGILKELTKICLKSCFN
jgi:hypothetical protein